MLARLSPWCKQMQEWLNHYAHEVEGSPKGRFPGLLWTALPAVSGVRQEMKGDEGVLYSSHGQGVAPM